MDTTDCDQPELIYPRKGTPHCVICCAIPGEDHDVWCNGTGTVVDPRATEATA